MKPYLIWTPAYSHASGGPKALHRLCHELNVRGREAYVSTEVTNPEWITPHRDPPLDGAWIAVYPEIVSGNPWEADRVVRWVLNVPGKRGGDTGYDPTERVFSWSTDYLDAPLLHIPYVETDIYVDRRLSRAGELFYVGKGDRGDSRDAVEITHEMREDRYALADALNRATLLRCFDDCTAMVDIALLCGCPVLVVPTGVWIAPDPGYRVRYLAQWSVFSSQLTAFIEVTQS